MTVQEFGPTGFFCSPTVKAPPAVWSDAAERFFPGTPKTPPAFLRKDPAGAVGAFAAIKDRVQLL